MGFTLTKVHDQRLDQNKGMVLVRKNPYKRFIQEGETPVIVQGGAFWSDAGDKIPMAEVPGWVKNQLELVTERGMAAIGMPPFEEIDWSADAKPTKKKVQNLNGSEETPEKPKEFLSVVDAVYSLDKTNDDHWTKDGKPDLALVGAMTGRMVTRGEVDETTSEYRRPE